MAWIESHQELARHPKTKRLARELGVSIPAAIGHLHLLWWWALDYADNGDLSKYQEADIADAILWEGDPSVAVSALIISGFVDSDHTIHDWHDYAGKLVERRENEKERSRKRRASAKPKSPKPTAQRVLPLPAQQPADVCATPVGTVPNSTVPNTTVPNTLHSERNGDGRDKVIALSPSSKSADKTADKTNSAATQQLAANLDLSLKANGLSGIANWGAARKMAGNVLATVPTEEALAALEWGFDDTYWRQQFLASEMKAMKRCWAAWRERDAPRKGRVVTGGVSTDFSDWLT